MKTLRKHRYKLFVSFIILFLVALFISMRGATLQALSIHDEETLGQRFLASIRYQFDILEDDFANDYINALGHYLIKPVQPKHFRYHFYIIKLNQINAFAAPGGHIFFYSGLIQAMDKIDELASVMCHEIGHVAARHLSQRVERASKIGLAQMAGMLAGIFVGGGAGAAMMAGTQAAGMQSQLAYSRTDERQADQLGFKYMNQSGFDPSGSITMLEKLQKGQGAGPNTIPQYLLTHPGGPERISNTEAMLGDYEPKPGNEFTATLNAFFPLFRAVVVANSLDPAEAEDLFMMELDNDPRSVPANLGLGIVFKLSWEYELAVDHLKKAQAEAPRSVPVLVNLGETYQLMGEDRQAIAVLQKALAVDSRNRGALFLLANTYQSLEDHENAIPLYKKLTVLGPVKNQVYYNLGVSYGRVNRLGWAHYNFGIFFARRGNREKAEFHFNTAMGHAEYDPALKRRIQKITGTLPQE